MGAETVVLLLAALLLALTGAAWWWSRRQVSRFGSWYCAHCETRWEGMVGDGQPVYHVCGRRMVRVQDEWTLR